MLYKLSLYSIFIGITFLYIIFLIPAKPIEELNQTTINTFITINGSITKDKNIQGFHILTINNFTVTCECRGIQTNTNLIFKGIVEEYKGKKQLRVLSITKPK